MLAQDKEKGTEKILDSNRLFYKIFKTKIGSVGILWKREVRKTKIIEIILPRFSLDAIKKNFLDIQPKENQIIEKIAKNIMLSVSGRQTEFSLNNFDLNRLGKFQRRVLMLTRKIPMGKIETYGRIAKKLGVPKGARAVGQALAKNPFPIVIPCHRVIRSDGTPGGFGGNVALKRRLLSIEKVAIGK